MSKIKRAGFKYALIGPLYDVDVKVLYVFADADCLDEFNEGIRYANDQYEIDIPEVTAEDDHIQVSGDGVKGKTASAIIMDEFQSIPVPNILKNTHSIYCKSRQVGQTRLKMAIREMQQEELIIKYTKSEHGPNDAKTEKKLAREKERAIKKRFHS